MNVAILVDYDNLLLSHKTAGLLDLATRVLMQLPKAEGQARGGCEMRLYGGWYEGTAMTKPAQDLSVALQASFPTVIRVPNRSGDLSALAVNASLAVSLIEEPAHHLFDTFRKKGKPQNVRVKDPVDVGCTDAACTLPLLKKLLRHGSCPVASCAVSATDLVYRSEQKIVDTMLTCDLLYAQHQGWDHVVLVSGDDDFIPPVRTLLLRGTSIIRIHPKFSAQRQHITVGTTRLHELEL
ncbi:NYN domain-containing protein [Janthinobacterium lividum]|uniref:NYN domain-containing protein n=1 Tax=Janthinobacterium lividum TaxID=29581 RepID=UPI001CD8B4E0|nr:NYN domain-containing protein [Janthinobacterium lividum]